MENRKLNRTTALVIAFIALWLVGDLGIYLIHRGPQWMFAELGGYDLVTIGQIGGYYLERSWALTPAAALVCFIVALSDFEHPVLTACGTVLAGQIVLFAIHLVRWPWSKLPNLDQSVPVLLEVLSIALLVGLTAFFAWTVAKILASQERKLT